MSMDTKFDTFQCFGPVGKNHSEPDQEPPENQSQFLNRNCLKHWVSLKTRTYLNVSYHLKKTMCVRQKLVINRKVREKRSTSKSELFYKNMSYYSTFGHLIHFF